MGYTPTTWVSGDTISDERMNKIERAIAGPWVVVNGSYDSNEEAYALDKTMGEIIAALPFVIVYTDSLQASGYSYIDKVEALEYYPGTYKLYTSVITYTTSSLDDYPTSVAPAL